MTTKYSGVSASIFSIRQNEWHQDRDNVSDNNEEIYSTYPDKNNKEGRIGFTIFQSIVKESCILSKIICSKTHNYGSLTGDGES
jgi:hypothetical protein